jgi:hypothetical protein
VTGVHPEHHREHADEDDRVAEERQERRHDDLLEHADVADDAHRQVAAARAHVVRERQPLQVVVEHAPDLGEHAVADQREADGGRVLRHGPQRDDGDQREARDGEQRLGRPTAGPHASTPSLGAQPQHPVEDQLQRPRFEQARADLGEQGEERTGEEQPVPAR